MSISNLNCKKLPCVVGHGDFSYLKWLNPSNKTEKTLAAKTKFKFSSQTCVQPGLHKLYFYTTVAYTIEYSYISSTLPFQSRHDGSQHTHLHFNQPTLITTDRQTYKTKQWKCIITQSISFRLFSDVNQRCQRAPHYYGDTETDQSAITKGPNTGSKRASQGIAV